jgi:hypothetical protein
MKKYLLSAIIMLTGLFALATGAEAGTGDVVVKINEDFMAVGKAFPAGTYKVIQDSPGTNQALILRGEQPGESVFLLPATRDTTSSEQRPEVQLTRVGDAYYLTEVATEIGVYTLIPPRVEARTAKATDQDTVSSPGSN